jgi:hypothetical protein
MDEFYEIETLVSIFEADADSVNESSKKGCDISTNFNVARALCVMCKEILELKGQLKGHMRNEHPFA